MRHLSWLPILAVSTWLALPAVQAQRRPYIGYTYPSGGQQGATVQIKLGGQDLDGVNTVIVNGTGVTARVLDYRRRLNNQEMQLLREQLKLLKQSPAAGSPGIAPAPMSDQAMMANLVGEKESQRGAASEDRKGYSSPQLIAAIEQRLREWVQNPACASISSLVIAEVTISPDAAPGARELRLATPRGVSNPLVFQIGQLPEYARKPMLTANLQVLGKEALALRNRPASEVECHVTLPCTVNGQIAAREVNRYRFAASKGQRLVISTQARQLIPFVADAVPGWFQPVLVLRDAQGREAAFSDDYRFKPDPVILYQVPEDGEYVVEIHDSLYRGREDFVYRISIGELPFVTSIFPMGRTEGTAVNPAVAGWNMERATLNSLPPDMQPGVHWLAASRTGFDSNPVAFAVDRLRDELEREANNSIAAAQKVTLPLIVNGRIDRPDDWDVFEFDGKAGETIVVEVNARRLDSSLDSVVKLTDEAGELIAFSDDREDLTAGVNTHHADSYISAKLPADGSYYVHLGDAARKGGEEYGYRLRVSGPQPDFALRVVPSSVSVGINASASVSIYAVRKDGFTGPIRLVLKDPPAGLSAAPVTMSAAQSVVRLNLRSGPSRTMEPLTVAVVGAARIGAREIVREAVPSEDRMQAFLWRHLVPAKDLQVMVFDPRYQTPAKRPAPARPAPAPTAAVAAIAAGPTHVAVETKPPGTAVATPPLPRPKFTKQQITGRLRQLKLLYEEGLLSDEFYDEKVSECEDGR